MNGQKKESVNLKIEKLKLLSLKKRKKKDWGKASRA